MAEGTVKWFDDSRGFGFITRTDGGDIFVHRSGILGDSGYKTLTTGDNVKFIAEMENGRAKAVDVEVI